MGLFQFYVAFEEKGNKMQSAFEIVNERAGRPFRQVPWVAAHLPGSNTHQN